MECRGADTTLEFDRQKAKIVAAMTEIDADVFGLMEIENDRASQTPDYAVADLVAGLNAIAGAGTYDYIATGAIGTDAIKVALLYKPSKVTPVGEYQVLDSTVDERFIDTRNRPTLAQVFEDNLTGETLIVAVNHLKSKGSPCEDIGDPDLGDGAGNCNLTRLAAAEAMVDWLADETYFPNTENVLIIGDLNAYDKEDPIDAIKEGSDDILDTDDDYLDMIHEFLGEEAYSYVFDGHIGYLDYALANESLADNIVDTTIWHINADEPDIIDYDMSFKQDAQDALYAPDPYRSSDHDPVIVSLRLNEAPTAVDDYYETGENETLVVEAPGVLANDSDPNASDDFTAVLKEETGPLHGDLTLNEDGSFTYEPDPGFLGEDSFEYYLVSLPTGMRSSQYVDSAKVTIIVNKHYFLPIILSP
jgi:predicted extracellular nuclease